MSKWTKYKLGEISKDIAMGPFGSNLKVDNFISEGVPVIRGANLNDGGFKKENFVFVSEEKANSLKRCLAYPDDLVFTHRGTLGQVRIIPTNGFEKYLVSQSQMRLTVNKKYLLPKYLYYFFKSPLGQSQLLKNTSQVGVPAIANPTKSLREVEIEIPDIETQDQISTILSVLDDKIELNNEMNHTLETMAQAIYKEWFVNFQFPGFDNKLLNGLPKGWRSGKLGDVLELLYGKALKAELRIEGQYPVVGSSGIVGYHNEYFVKGPGIVIGRKGTIGEVIWLDESFYPIDTTFYVKDSLGVKGLFYHYFLLKEQEFKKISSDSAVPGLNRNHALDNNVIVPANSAIDLFNLGMVPLFERKLLINEENDSLTKIRDSLLPKLIAGKIAVKQG